VKDENGDLFADSHNILNRWKNYFSQLLNVHNVSDVRYIEVHTADALVPGPSFLEVEIAVAKLKKYRLPGSDEILQKLFKQEVKHYCLVGTINSLVLFGIWKNFLISGRSLLLCQFTKKKGKTDCSNYRGILLLSMSTEFYLKVKSVHR
jgi:hypothetical protein